VYATLWHVLRTATLLFNPITPYLSEALHQKVYRQLDPALPESVNFEEWPKPDLKLRNPALEQDFQTLFECVSLLYSARQSAKLKRRWPLSKMVVVANDDVRQTLGNVEDLLLELSNVKTVEYAAQPPENLPKESWASASQGSMQVLLSSHRDKTLLGEGLMRDLARRVQALRKELGYTPTDILEAVHVAEIDDDSIALLEPYLKEMAELIRARKVHVHGTREASKAEWHECQLDDRSIYVAISQ
jgi:valyl-tRNA synthetase